MTFYPSKAVWIWSIIACFTVLWTSFQILPCVLIVAAWKTCSTTSSMMSRLASIFLGLPTWPLWNAFFEHCGDVVAYLFWIRSGLYFQLLNSSGVWTRFAAFWWCLEAFTSRLLRLVHPLSLKSYFWKLVSRAKSSITGIIPRRSQVTWAMRANAEFLGYHFTTMWDSLEKTVKESGSIMIVLVTVISQDTSCRTFGLGQIGGSLLLGIQRPDLAWGISKLSILGLWTHP